MRTGPPPVRSCCEVRFPVARSCRFGALDSQVSRQASSEVCSFLTAATAIGDLTIGLSAVASKQSSKLQ